MTLVPLEEAEKRRGKASGAHQLGGELPLIWFDELKPCLDATDFIEDLLCEGQMSVVYGESNTGKTFFATDLSIHVALGWPWRGRAVDGGGVIYVAAEGGFGIRNRLKAFEQHHELTVEHVPLGIVPASVDLLNPSADTKRLIKLIDGAAARLAQPVRLLVIDTLSRALAGGNENASEDMGALVRHADLIRQQTGAHLLFVHHSGKDAAKGARGHSLLRAATDTEIEVSKDADTGIATARVTKQRELPCRGEFPFRLAQVVLGENRRGKPVTSCAVIPEKPEAITGMAARIREYEVETAFLAALRDLLSRGVLPSQTPAAKGNYAPVLMAGHDSTRQFTRQQLTQAMTRLLAKGTITLRVGRNSSRHTKEFLAPSDWAPEGSNDQ